MGALKGLSIFVGGQFDKRGSMSYTGTIEKSPGGFLKNPKI